jgi:ubiquinol-cytochrome c reductase cytochrome b subunit
MTKQNVQSFSKAKAQYRDKKFTAFEISWNQWLAGLIDGDGYLAIQKSNDVAVCEITMPLEDEKVLQQIQQKLGGSITLRSGAKAVRYRLCHQIGIKNLILRINGSIRNTVRIPQFQTLCNKFNVAYLEPKPLTLDNGYIAGFFDADGTIYISINKASPKHSIIPGTEGKIIRLQNSRGHNQLRIEISNKYKENLMMFKKAFNSGSIRTVVNRKKHVVHIYQIEHVESFLQYVRKYPLYSTKKKRLLMVKNFLELKQMKSHLAPPSSMKQKVWNRFCKKWYN